MSTGKALKVLEDLENYADDYWDDITEIDRVHEAVSIVKRALEAQEVVGTINLKGESYYITGVKS